MLQLQTIGQYEIIEMIGVGGMGVVYKAVNTETRQTVAIKQLKEHLSTPEFLERFRREGDALRQLNHPNIVKMHAAFAHEEQHYLVVEYIEGGSLRDLMKEGILTPKRILEIALDIADALTRAHRLDIIHRDLKPANILIASDGTPRLTDFGVALVGHSERVTETGALVGTLDYLAPELLDGQPIDARADIWAFGVMLFEMLTGKTPFAGEGVSATLMRILNNPVPDLEALRPDVPVAFIDLIYRMLEKDRQRRIPSVRIVGAEIEAILRGSDMRNKRSTQLDDDAPTYVFRVADQPSTPATGIPKNNLPSPMMEFVGRATELEELARLVKDNRLVTVVGSGGMGKTRLALEFAHTHLSDYKGVFWIELAPLSTHEEIINAMADAMGFSFQQSNIAPDMQLASHLHDKEYLLIFDNFEHMLMGASHVGKMLEKTAHLKVLITSRERLNLSNEMVYQLAGMDFPEWETPEDALHYSAVKLFKQSARRVRPDFTIHSADLPHIARICRRVEGLPLGIILAAGWIEMLSPREVAEEMAKSMDFLESDLRDLPERHRSLRAVFDYSWKLLEPAQQKAFVAVAVFKGGFSREAAQTIANANLRTLNALVNKSLLRRDIHTGRYFIHELIREYALGLLLKSPNYDALRDAHAAYFADLFSKMTMNDIHRMEPEFENARLAWKRCVEKSDFEHLRPLIYAFDMFLRSTTRDTQGGELFEMARQKFKVDTRRPTSLNYEERLLLSRFAEYKRELMMERLEKALDLARQDDDKQEIAYSLFGIGVTKMYMGDSVGVSGYLEESILVYTEIGESILMPANYLILNYLGRGYYAKAFKLYEWIKEELEEHPYFNTSIMLYMTTFHFVVGEVTGDFSGAKRSLAEVEAYAEKLNDQVFNLGLASTQLLFAIQAGELAKGNAIAQHIEQLVKRSGIDTLNIGGEHCTAEGHLRLAEGNMPLAAEFYKQVLAESAPGVDVGGFWGMAVVYLSQNKPYEALESLRQFWTHSLNSVLKMRDGQITDVEPPPGIKVGAAYFTHGNIHLLAAIQMQKGNPTLAAQLLGALEQRPYPNVHWVEKLPLFADLPAQLKAKMGESAYQAAYNQGKTAEVVTLVRQAAAQ